MWLLFWLLTTYGWGEEMVMTSLVLKEFEVPVKHPNEGYGEQWDTGLGFRREPSPGDADLRVIRSCGIYLAHSWRMCLLRRGKFFIF